MALFDRCPTCKQLKFTSHHICPPRWYVVFVGEDGDPGDELEDIMQYRPIYANSAAEAAEMRVARWDDGGLAHEGDEVEVIVYDQDGLNPKHYDVTGDVQPIYTACESIKRKASA